MKKIIPVDRWKWLLHFIFGAIFGAALGFGTWLRCANPKSVLQMSIFTGIGALLIGTLAATKLDAFWESIKGDGSFRINPW